MEKKLPFRLEDYPDLLELLLSLDDQGVLWLDRSGNIRYANRAAAARLGYQKGSLEELQVFDLEEELTLMEYKKRWRELEAKGKLLRNVAWKSRDGIKKNLQLEGCIARSTSPALSCWRVQPLGGDTYLMEAVRSFMEQRGAAAWQWDLVEGHFSATSSFFEILSLNRADLPPDRQLNVLSALKGRMVYEDFQQLMQKIKELQRDRKPFQQEFSPQNAGNSPQALSLYGEPVEQSGVVGKIRGILLPQWTEGNFDRLAKIALDRSDAMICWIEPNYRFRYVNDALCEQLGYSRRELLDEMEITDIDAEHTQAQWEDIWDRASDERAIKMESTLKTKQERVFPVDLYLNYLKIGDQKLISLNARDITGRRRKEADLKQSMLKVQALSEQLEAENVYLKEEVAADYNFENILTQSPAYKKVLQQIEQVAPTEATVLIEGETGTGKELLAHAIHNLSSRREHSMVRVNCAALSEELILSELFGHEKGAFTGANERKIGRFELADRGSLFLDEIGEVSLDTQSKLLRVLQEGEFERLGGVETIGVDVRIIAATNRDLREMVKKKAFREDLYYRLSVFPLVNLPLRKRREDIPLLVRHFMQKFAKKNGKKVDHIRAKDMKRLKQYDFPGNIRELMNIVEQAVVLSRSSTLDFSYWNPAKTGIQAGEDEAETFPTLEELQRQHIIDALEKTHWRVTGPQGAARLLGLKGQTLFSKMKKLGIKRE